MFILTGPTAAGKSELAVEIALRCDAEIVNADAFQVYAGLPLLTAQPAPALAACVPHHLLGVIPLAQSFDAGKFLAHATASLAAIAARGRRALVVGGTGLYLRALLRGLEDLPPSDPALRQRLGQLSLAQLQQEYAALDPLGMTFIDRANPRRLVRAIEVSLLTGSPFSSFRADWSSPHQAARPQPCRGVVLIPPREALHARIDERVRQMFARGVVGEVRAAAAHIGPTASQAIGFGEILSLLRGEISEPACIAAIQQRTRRYAKRQLTWFRREPTLSPFPLADTSLHHAVQEIARLFLAARAE